MGSKITLGGKKVGNKDKAEMGLMENEPDQISKNQSLNNNFHFPSDPLTFIIEELDRDRSRIIKYES